MAQGIDTAIDGTLVGAVPRAGTGSRLDRISEGRFAALVSLPGLVLLGLAVIPPVLSLVVLSLFRIELTHDNFRPFVTLRNYAVRLGTDEFFLESLPRTIAFAAIATAIAVPMALAAASLIHGRSRRASAALGLLLLIPWAIAPVADGLFWKLLFDTRTGVLNQVLRVLGAPPINQAEAPGVLLVTLVAVAWRTVPLLAVLILGALRQVPADLGRAARVDGASGWQTFRFVTLPAIAPTVLIAILLAAVLALQTFEIQFAVVGDSPPKNSALTGYVLFRTMIGEISLGYGAAAAIAFGLVVAACVAVLAFVLTRPRLAWWRKGVVGSPGLAEPVAPLPQAKEAWSAAKARDPVSARPDQPDPPQAWRRVLGRTGRMIAIGLLVLWLIGPLVWILVASTQTNAAMRAFPPALSTALRVGEYQTLLGDREWQGAAVITVIIATGATLLALIVATLAAYPLARYRPRGGRFILAFLWAMLLLPPIALAIPVLFVIAGLGLRNSVLGLVLVNAAFWTPILVWLVRGAFLNVPENVERAARVDGASRLRTIFRITVPIAAPSVAAAAAIAFIGIWNDFTFVAILGGRDTHTLPRYLGTSFTPSYPVLAATIVLTVAPCIALVALLRRRILGLF